MYVNELGWCDCDMSERSNDNPPELELSEGEDFDDDFVPDGAWPLCPKCLTPCRPLEYYCPHCGSNDAINPLTPYIPFLNIRFNYDIFCTMWRKIWYDPQTLMVSRLFYLLMIALFVPFFIVLGMPFLLLGRLSQSRIKNTTIMLLCLIAIVLLALFFRFGLMGWM